MQDYEIPRRQCYSAGGFLWKGSFTVLREFGRTLQRRFGCSTSCIADGPVRGPIRASLLQEQLAPQFIIISSLQVFSESFEMSWNSYHQHHHTVA